MEHRQITPDEWDALAANPQFRALIRARRRFAIPATVFFVAYYLALPVLLGFAPALMRRPVLGPLSLAYAFALSQFVMAWVLLGLYLWRARGFDVRAALVAKHERETLREATP